MTAMKQSAKDGVTFGNAAVTGDFRENSDRKTTTLKVFEEIETDRESCGSSSEDTENYSPRSVVSKARKWQAAGKDVNVDVFGRRVHSQVVRIRAEDSHLGEDIGEWFITKVSGAGHDLVDVMIFSRPASPLSGKVATGINMVQ